MGDSKRISEIKEFWIPALEMHVGIGWTAPVEELILKFQDVVADSKDTKLTLPFQKAAVWLENAKQKEAQDGKDCLLDKEHKYYKIYLESRGEFLNREISKNPRPVPVEASPIPA